ncbi:SRPBCC family protein [Pseudomarimonas arenosa]|uniref:SRPBCC family protein n=1 Tax=Pseudomarimonas arenosa TaxID=2774145 RepID=A0AAW3ZNW9_9GAMM|nr:SRPBCC family protein [Pseudomarimonas arenosa]MBD8525966.1 SRPBCC family protein [Pseudomarimonas arenosa]
MRTIHVTRQLNSPIDHVFDLLADHAGYTRFPGVRAARVTRAGQSDRNGLGAVRVIDLGNAWFEEEIIEFEPPTRLGYLILRSKPPMEHQGGRITLTANEQGCLAEWTSTFRISVPVAGPLLTWFAVKSISRGFAAVLKTVERLAAESSTQASA